jgi:hypothetical protein
VNEGRNNDWGKLALLSAAVAAGGLYDTITSTAAPSHGATILQFILLACMLIGLVGWVMKYRSQT